MNEQAVDYSKTVLLPKTSFPMRAELPKREPLLLEFWEKNCIYKKTLEVRKEKPRFILHDGPPYANGHIHMGHVLNKVLKDISVKSQAMSGHFAPYVPGWDCHGLPIEQELLKKLKIAKRHVQDVPAFRAQAREFARGFIDIQRSEFKRLAVLGDWENPYITMSPEYEGTVIAAFLELLKKGYIYRGKKTVYWCVSCETALADAEVEYKDKTSSSIYARLAVENPPQSLSQGRPLFLAVWTTTPWTLPANRAAAVKTDENYRLIKTADGLILAADKLADKFISEAKLECSKEGVVSGEELLKLQYHHPLSGQTCPVISADFVDMETGTGIVHIAPGHGEDDYHAGLANKLEIFCPVDERGRFTAEAGEFAGKTV